MKYALWVVPVIAVVVAVVVWAAPRLRQAYPVGPGQPTEAQVLLSQAWARAHARPIH